MDKVRVRRVILGLLLGLVAICGAVPSVRLVLAPPATMRLIKGVEQDIRFRIPLSLSIVPSEGGSVMVNDVPIPANTSPQFRTPVRIVSQEVGRLTMRLKLFGLIPVRKVVVDVLPALRVVPGGQAIGVLLTSEGVIVVAHTSLEGLDGVRRYPAEEAGVEVGDVIVRVNGEAAKSSEHLSQLVSKYSAQGRTLGLEIKRGSKTLLRRLVPVLTRTDARGGFAIVGAEYKMGLYVEDSVAGVGTLTFYCPDSGRYAALGHVITDGATNHKIQVREGRIVRAGISGIQQGLRGQPGEKIGTFEGAGDIAGDIKKNSEFGIYGRLSHMPDAEPTSAIPIAVAGQIRTGPAEMLTVISESKVERFKVEIQRVYRQDRPQTKGLVVKVVDTRLLSLTGGIIQGMSGSPIVQDGRLVGAVTHVFVNDPTRGYGVLAEWMVIEAGLVDEVRSQPAHKAAA